ncbi:MAG: efflux transporter outer membrane subunit [Tepidisphaeraceae bacterium]|jgi:NodT family efflux transporter outer membrane factor (OMF) lipoprotein
MILSLKTPLAGAKQRVAIFPLVLLALWGCAVGPDYKQPEMKTPGQYEEIGSATRPTTRGATQVSVQPDYLRWWTTLNDPTLNGLIDRAVKNNPDVLAAEARIREARANRGIQASGLFPDVGAQGSYTHERESQNLPGVAAFTSSGGGAFPGIESDLWQAGFDATWEIDVFGGTRRAIESANYSVQAAQWDRRDVLVSLLAEVAVNYVELRGAQLELEIAQENLQSQQQTLDLTRRKAEGGLIPYLDVAQQEAQVATTASVIPTLQAQVRQTIHHLGILLGEAPGSLSDELTAAAPIPVGPASVPPGLPGELLRRRPDVRRAERQLAAATAQIGVATADLYPKFSITGAMGVESQSLKQLFDYTSRTYQIVPGVTWDIFNAGKVSSNIDVQTARQAEALQAYRKAVLQSMEDVEDSLVAYNREQVRLQSVQEAVDANQRAVDLSMELFQKGSADFLSVLDAQRSLFAAQDAQAQSEQQVSADLVALYKALGGGWD